MSWLTSKIAMIGGAVLAGVLIFLKIFGMGKKSAYQEVAAKTTETVLEVTKDAKKVREQVRTDGPDAAFERMRKRNRNSDT